jgi:hypothetical protein
VRRTPGRAALGSVLTLGALTVGAAALSVATAPRLVVGATPSTTGRPWVPHRVSSPPPGWVPVAFGSAQISVPSSWFVVSGGAAACDSGVVAGVLLLDWSGRAEWCPPGMGPGVPDTSVVTLSRAPTGAPLSPPIGAYGSSLEIHLPSLGVGYSSTGPAVPGIFPTLSLSARSNVLAPGAGPPVPGRWKRVSFAGLSFSVPRRWPVERLDDAPPCSHGTVLSLRAGPAVALTRHAPLALPCPAPSLRPVAPVNGVEVDAWRGSYLGTSDCDTRPQAGLRLCLDRSSPGSILFVKVTEPGGRTLGVQIGLAGDGRIARTVLASLSG